MRKNNLKKLYEGIQRFEEEIFQALKLDLNKSVHESFTIGGWICIKKFPFNLKYMSSWVNRNEFG